MKYLVLHQFRTFGKTLYKGQVVDESEIRSPSLRMSEGKIVPAVSSSTVPAEEVTEVSVAPPQVTEDVDNTPEQSEQSEQSEQLEQPAALKKFNLLKRK